MADAVASADPEMACGVKGLYQVTRKRLARASSIDVARLAGVSIAAVSRAFTPGSSISEELAEKVHKAARQLKYVPNTLASSLITRETNIVALMLANLGNPIYSAMLAEASRRLEEIGKQVLLFTPRDAQDFDQSLQRMLRYQVDAIVITAASISSRMASLCLDRDVPVVMLGRHVPGLPVHSVRGNAREGGRLVAELMLEGGGRRFGVIGGPMNLTTILERKEAVMARLHQDIDVSDVIVCDGGLTYSGGYQAALKLMSSRDPPDSVVCLTDIMALGAMDAIRFELNRKIPEDVAVTGFDDIAEAGHASYRLSTVRTPVREMIDHMIALISRKPKNDEPKVIELKAELIIRDTTRLDTAKN
jgi:DNA-binding LacI/PurR family transcriptional regulator